MLTLLLVAWIQASAPACPDAADCRRQASEAIARGEFELAHDLSWRAVQKGRPNDPELMLALARAQSLSGRPGDALVMLGRLADLGVRPDIGSDPDFRRIRDLAGWPALEVRFNATTSPATSRAPAAAAPARLSAGAPASVAPPAPSSPAAPVDEVAFSAPGVSPFALAHDAVSRRFVLGDRAAHRLLVVDEVSHNVVNFVSAAGAGFYEELTAFTIDTRRGDLWVASARGEGGESASVVHKLQLVSGRPLSEIRAPDKAGAVRFAAIAVGADGAVFALDTIGSRLFRARPGSKTLDDLFRVDAEGAMTIAPVDDRALYVGTAKGILRVDLVTRAASRVRSGDDLGGFVALAWRTGSLVGVEQVGTTSRVVRLKLDAAGTRVQSREVLAASAAAAGTLAGDSYYYLSDTGTIRRLSVK